MPVSTKSGPWKVAEKLTLMFSVWEQLSPDPFIINIDVTKLQVGKRTKRGITDMLRLIQKDVEAFRAEYAAEVAAAAVVPGDGPTPPPEPAASKKTFRKRTIKKSVLKSAVRKAGNMGGKKVGQLKLVKGGKRLSKK